MHFNTLISLAIALIAHDVTATTSGTCPPFPTTLEVYSSHFAQPKPPVVTDEYKTSFIQHKWNANLSHITSGFITASPSKGFVRIQEAFEGNMATSYFNYANVTSDGLVDNTMTTYPSTGGKPQVFRGYVNSDFPLLAKDFLVKSGGVFGGLVQRQFNQGRVAKWNILYQGVIPVTVYVNNCNLIVGYDYFNPDQRTNVITEYFNIET